MIFEFFLSIILFLSYRGKIRNITELSEKTKNRKNRKLKKYYIWKGHLIPILLMQLISGKNTLFLRKIYKESLPWYQLIFLGLQPDPRSLGRGHYVSVQHHRKYDRTFILLRTTYRFYIIWTLKYFLFKLPKVCKFTKTKI